MQREDAAYAYRDDRVKLRIHQAVSTTGAAAAGGALWGTLIGCIFSMPLAGMAIGTGSGAQAGKLADIGINDTREREESWSRRYSPEVPEQDRGAVPDRRYGGDALALKSR